MSLGQSLLKLTALPLSGFKHENHRSKKRIHGESSATLALRNLFWTHHRKMWLAAWRLSHPGHKLNGLQPKGWQETMGNRKEIYDYLTAIAIPPNGWQVIYSEVIKMTRQEFKDAVQSKFPHHQFTFPFWSGLYVAKSLSNQPTMVVVNWSRTFGWEEEISLTAISE